MREYGWMNVRRVMPPWAVSFWGRSPFCLQRRTAVHHVGGAALPAGCALLLRMGTRIACALADQRIGSDLRRGIGPPRDPDLRQLHLRLTGGCYGDHGPEARRC